MALDKPCSMGCGRWGRLISDLCATCAANKSVHKGKRPAQRMKYRQRLALATRRQMTYAEEFGDPLKIEEVEIEDAPRKKAEVIRIGPHIKARRKANAVKRRRA